MAEILNFLSFRKKKKKERRRKQVIEVSKSLLWKHKKSVIFLPPYFFCTFYHCFYRFDIFHVCWLNKILKRPVYILAFGLYNSKQVNVSGIQIFSAHFLALHLRKVILNAANIYLELYTPNANIYTFCIFAFNYYSYNIYIFRSLLESFKQFRKNRKTQFSYVYGIVHIWSIWYPR